MNKRYVIALSDKGQWQFSTFHKCLKEFSATKFLQQKKKKKIRCKMLTGMKAIGKDTVSHYGHFLLSLNFSPTNTEDRCLKFHAILVFDKLGEYMDPVLVL